MYPAPMLQLSLFPSTLLQLYLRYEKDVCSVSQRILHFQANVVCRREFSISKLIIDSQYTKSPRYEIGSINRSV